MPTGSSLAIRSRGVFSDEVFTSSDLNRRAGAVLRQARKHPVTISSSGTQFALLLREDASAMVRAVNDVGEFIEVIQGALAVRMNQEPQATVAWIKEFDDDDRLSMLSEILAPASRQDWDEVGNIIHQWRESAAVLKSGQLEAAMNEKAEEREIDCPETAALVPTVSHN